MTTHSGDGRLVIGGVEHPCRYQLHVRSTGQLKTASGLVTANSGVLWSAFVASTVKVVMSDGRFLPVVITSYGPGQPDAPFKLDGALG